MALEMGSLLGLWLLTNCKTPKSLRDVAYAWKVMPWRLVKFVEGRVDLPSRRVLAISEVTSIPVERLIEEARRKAFLSTPEAVAALRKLQSPARAWTKRRKT